MASSQDNKEEADTCRICRGEGSQDEPLFHPCKCSGSIMFVHQDCLMEWLSHSQKKHCELCKTSFTFTKLYHPHMPKTLPLGLFIRKASVHAFNYFLTWCRALLVVLTWLIWLPWSMRFVWWGLYWLADGGWNVSINASIERMMMTASNDLLFSSDSMPSNSLAQPSPTTLHSVSRTLDWELGSFRALVTQTFPSLFGYSAVNDTAYEDHIRNVTVSVVEGPGRSTLLSRFSLFKRLTQNRFVNNFVMDVLEGQLITLLVVAAFVLVFLIREWVVQQQPMINMAALEDHHDEEVGREGNRNQAATGIATRDVTIDGGRPGSPNDAARTALGLAEIEQLEATIKDLRAKHSDLASSDNFEDSSDLIDMSTADREHLLLQNVQNMTAMFDDRVRAAKGDMSLKEMTGLLRRLTEFDDALIHLPNSDVQQVRDKLRTIRFSISQAILDASDEPSRANPDTEQTEPGQVENDAQTATDTSALRARPAMSKRLESSLATDIQRSLQEENKANGRTVHNPTEDAELTPIDQGREGSPSSWQLVPSPAKETGNHFETIARQSQEFDKEPMRSEKHSQDVAELRPPPDHEDHQGVDHSSESLQKAEVTRKVLQHEKQDDAVKDEANPALILSGRYPSSMDSSSDVPSSASPTYGTVLPSKSGLTMPPTSKDPPVQAGSNGDDIAESSQVPSARSDTEHSSGTGPPLGSTRDVPNALMPVDTDLVPLPSDDSSGSSVGQPSNHARSLLDHVFDWLWGEVGSTTQSDPAPVDDEHVVDNVADEAPFVPFANAQPENVQQQPPAQGQDHDHHAAALGAGVGANAADAEQVEDVEDLEGLLELVGMQGNIVGLFQNAIFMSVVISATIASAVWFPFLFGKGIIILVVHPLDVLELPAHFVTSVTNLFVDCMMIFLASAVILLCQAVDISAWIVPRLGSVIPFSMHGLANMSTRITNGALTRINETITGFSGTSVSDSGQVIFDSLSSLRVIESCIHNGVMHILDLLVSIYSHLVSQSDRSETVLDFCNGLFKESVQVVWDRALAATIFVSALPELLWSSEITINFQSRSRVLLDDSGPLQWRAADRILATCTGYVFVAALAVTYVTCLAPLARSRSTQRIENIALGVLDQAGGVLKVILIISIEMLAFPFYCGLLLDVALLPCFGGASVQSRILWTLTSPWTSVFLHWFIGTCYMFHFALFVSMCRKILRNGVLFFIRDPDDPNFHPVRDVLERPVTTQLRKIISSAVIYGGLILFCLGSVVWTIAYSFDGIMPIRWSSQSASLSYQDLLLYTLVKPMAIRYLTPSGAVQQACEWWFHNCARRLRLSSFLFDQRSENEEPTADNTTHRLPPGGGRFARVPASDQVRIPRGRHVFLEVDSENNRIDGEPDAADGAHGHNNTNYKVVYVPPQYRVRITLFAFCLWLLVAITGLSITLIPLQLGRSFFAALVGSEVLVNDVYSYSLGFTLLASLTLAYQQRQDIFNQLRSYQKTVISKIPITTTTRIAPPIVQDRVKSALTYVDYVLVRGLRNLYTYTTIGVLFPILFAFLIEAYLVGPLHEYVTAGKSPHTVHFVTDWVFGVQLLRIAIRAVRWNENSRVARASKAVFAKGWTDPDVTVFFRGFVLPVIVCTVFLLTAPLPFASVASALRFGLGRLHEPAVFAAKIRMYRFAYPSLLVACLSLYGMEGLVRAIGRWRMRIRDEVYLIGERLHNFGDKRPGAGSKFGGGVRVRD
ncbi:MAG: hypothetical protein M1828_000315 [Chrysothrix sp. TS-e1954]|nr:MAG: hypothetical protein M1828_000315 [Chrysothrix sp. TS-e1954]